MVRLFYLSSTASTEIYTLSLHDALPICGRQIAINGHIKFNLTIPLQQLNGIVRLNLIDRKSGSAGMPRPISYAVFCLKKKKIQVPTLRCNLNCSYCQVSRVKSYRPRFHW